MAETKKILKTERFTYESGELTIKSIPGNAHYTTCRIYVNKKLIGFGQGVVERQASVNKNDTVKVKATINKPEGTSVHAALSVTVGDDKNMEQWSYTSPEPGYNEVIYEVLIILI